MSSDSAVSLPPAAGASSPPAPDATVAPRRIKLNRVRSSPEEEAAMIAGAEDSHKRARTDAPTAATTAASSSESAPHPSLVAVPESAEQLQRLLASLPSTAAEPTPAHASSASAASPRNAAASAAASAASGRRVLQLGSSAPVALAFAPSTGKRGGRDRASSSAEDASGCSLSISGFTRPVTAAQIEELLQSFGETTQLCVHPLTFNPAQVTYTSADSAAQALAHLHKRRDWPQAGSRPLSARRITDEEVKETVHRNHARAGAAAKPQQQERHTKQGDDARKREEAARLRAAQGVALYRARSLDSDGASAASPSARSSARHVITLKNKRGGGGGGMTIGLTNDDAIDGDTQHTGQGQGQRTVHTTRTFNVDDEAQSETDDAPAAPTCTLDSLFRKTAFLPALYWLPCTEQEIQDKQRKLERR